MTTEPIPVSPAEGEVEEIKAIFTAARHFALPEGGIEYKCGFQAGAVAAIDALEIAILSSPYITRLREQRDAIKAIFVSARNFSLPDGGVEYKCGYQAGAVASIDALERAVLSNADTSGLSSRRPSPLTDGLGIPCPPNRCGEGRIENE